MRFLGFGISKPSASESARIFRWEQRLRWLEILFLVLTIPAFYLELSSGTAHSSEIGRLFYGIAGLGILATHALLSRFSPHPLLFFRSNWLPLLIAVFALANIVPTPVPWTAWEWFLRGSLAIMGFFRMVWFFVRMITPGSLPHVLLMALGVLAVAGAGFYWLEPGVHSYGEGLWLAFVSAATVGYGDFLPTTPASRIFAVFIVLLGYTVLSLVTASIAAMLIGEEEDILRRELHADIRKLHDEIRHLREEIASLRNKR